jgi:hypothetical protein
MQKDWKKRQKKDLQRLATLGFKTQVSLIFYDNPNLLRFSRQAILGLALP